MREEGGDAGGGFGEGAGSDVDGCAAEGEEECDVAADGGEAVGAGNEGDFSG